MKGKSKEIKTEINCYRLWAEVQKASSDRGQSLDSALEVARKFWQQLETVMAALGELADALAAQPPPAAQPSAIQAQQVALQEIRHEIDHTKPEVRLRNILTSTIFYYISRLLER